METQKTDVKKEEKTDEGDPTEITSDPRASEDQKSEEKKEESTESDGSSKAEEEQTDAIDYAAELERETKHRKTAEFSSEQYRKENADLKKQLVEQEAGDEKEEAPTFTMDDVEARAKEIASKQVKEFSSNLVSDVIDEAVEALATTADEAKLILYHYDNTISHSGVSRTAVIKDMQRAKLIANESRLKRDHDELIAALQSERGKHRGTAGSQRKHPEHQVALTDAEEAIAQRMSRQNKDLTIEQARKKLADAKKNATEVPAAAV